MAWSLMEINRNSPLPLYFQLKQLLSEKIQHGDWKPGDKLPTEEEIQQKYDISRTTIRQALRELELEGMITRQAGRGTFVTLTKVQEGPSAFELEMSEYVGKGLQLSWKVVQAGEVPAPDKIAEWLQIQPGAGVFRLQRLRIANDLVVGHGISYVTGECIGLIDLSLAETGGSMNYLSRIDLPRCTAERVLEALPADREDVRLLEIERGTPVLVMSRVLRDPDSRPFEFFRGVNRGDRYRYHIQRIPVQL
jgi:GntR family transcriptional regulator